MSLRARILTLVAGFIIMTVVVMLFGLSTISDYNRMMAGYGQASENAYRGERLNYLISSAVMESRGIYNARTHADIELYAGRLDRDLDRLEAEMTQWRHDGIAGPGLDLGSLEVKTSAFVEVRRSLSRAARTESARAAERIGDNTRQARMQFQADIERVVTQTRAEMLEERARADTYRNERILSFILVTLAWIAVTAGLSVWLVSHFITRELSRAQIAEEAREKLLKELVESNTELERFAYVASHDMQEPVRMVNMYSQLVAEDYGSKLDEKGRRHLRTIAAQATRMQMMVQDLLRYSRVRHDQGEAVTIDLNEQMKHIRANFAQLLADSGARIDAEGLPEVSGNAIQIQRLFENLISNGIKYQPPGQLPVITITASDAGDRWRIAVQDNGIGIDPDYAGDIFEPFRRLHTWDEYQGTGLGLTICRKIVQRHGGTIGIEPSDGPGARFVFTLPKPVVPANGGHIDTIAA